MEILNEALCILNDLKGNITREKKARLILIINETKSLLTNVKQPITTLDISTQTVDHSAISPEVNNSIIPTYAEVCKLHKAGNTTWKPNNTTNQNVLIVQPTTISNSTTTLNILKSNINPSELKIGITSTRHLKSGGIAVSVKGNDALLKLKNIIDTNHSSDLSTNIPTKKNPCLIFKKIPKETTPDEFITKIVAQNNLSLLTDDITFCFGNSRRISKYKNLIFRVQPIKFWELLRLGALNFDWLQIQVEKFTPVTRCFNCLKLGHTSRQCTEAPVCAKCGDTHAHENCSVQHFNCRLCLNIPKYRYKANHHALNTSKCNSFHQYVTKQESRTNYGLPSTTNHQTWTYTSHN